MKTLFSIAFATVIVASSRLSAQSEAQILDLSHRLESAWKIKSNQAFEALYCTDNVDQFLVDTTVSTWVYQKDFFKSDSKFEVVKYYSKAELEELADPKNGGAAGNYKAHLDSLTKPNIMNNHSYIWNLPAVGMLEISIESATGGKIRKFIAVGLNKDGTLKFMLQKRG